ncbi:MULTISPECIES: hypothetical protein [Nocardia]|uniref:hypothetical protein n=1 Tax=Nocardia TaxID=1817 RepID=UPI0018952F72|nr:MULTISPECIES: hypothetical protein [Nocardia]MBF6350011.1 hypothetical protein [Nocardia flavorosea]
MSYPYGQPPHQPGYPAPGFGYPPPAYAAAPGPYGHPPAPSGGTGITAGILALLGGLVSAITAISMYVLAFATSESSLTNGAVLATGARRRSSSSSSSSGPDIDIDFEFAGIGIVWGLIYTVIALALLIGGIMLLRRRNAGRVTVIVGCVAFVILSVLMLGIVNLISGLFALLTLILAAVGSTKRWIDAARMPAVPAMAGGYGATPYGY